MKKLILFFLIIGLVFSLAACNTPTDDDTGGGGGAGGGGDGGGAGGGGGGGGAGGGGGGGAGGGVDVVYDWGIPGAKLDLPIDGGNNYPGREINLADCSSITGTIGDISLYGEIVLFAVLYKKDGTEITGKGNGLAQFSILLDGSSGWDDNNKLAEKYNLVSSSNVSTPPKSGKTGKPGKLLVQGSYNIADYTDAKVASIEVQKLTFKLKTEGGGTDDGSIIFSWGSGVETDTFPTDTKWPGRSLPLSGASEKTGTLGDMSLYKEVIVDATVYDRADNIATASDLIDPAFFVLVTDNSNWTTYETVKQYGMAVDGPTSVTPETNKVDASKSTCWKGIPTDIAFMGEYNSSVSNNKTVGKVLLKSITFVPK